MSTRTSRFGSASVLFGRTCRSFRPVTYYTPFLPYDTMVLPEKVAGDWDDIPKAGINYKTSVNMKMDIRRQKKALGGYYAVGRLHGCAGRQGDGRARGVRSG